jgi:PAS domain S-box-containing protein/putative nucleotidyltransferase with HDIG domain
MRREKIRILFLTRDKRDIKIALDSLKGAGFNIEPEIISKEQEFEEKIGRKIYDVVFSDLKFDGNGGLKVLSKVREKGLDIPIIIISSRAEEKDALKTLKKGIADYILKEEFSRTPVVLERVLTHTALERQRARLNELFKEAEERYRRIVESTLDGITVIQGDRIVFANPRASEILGIPRDKLLGNTFDCIVSASYEKSKSGLKECKFKKPDGREAWIEIAVSPIMWQGLPARLVTFRDITYRKRAENELRKRHREIRFLKDFNENVLTSIEQGVIVLDREGKIKYFNRFVREFLNWNGGVMGKNFFEIFPYYREIGLRELFLKIVDGKSSMEKLRIEEYDTNDRPSYRQFYLYPFSDRNRVNGVVIVVEDITDQVLLQEKEKKRAEELSVIHEISREALFSLSITELFKKIAEALHNRFHYNDVFIALISPEDKKLKKLVKVGIHSNLVNPLIKARKLKGGKCILDEVAISGKSLIVRDVEETNLSPLVPETRSALSVPIRRNGKVIGVIQVENYLPETFDEIDLLALETLADEVVSALEFAELFEALNHRNTVLEMVNFLSRKIARTLEVKKLGSELTKALVDNFHYERVSFYILEDGENPNCVISRDRKKKYRIRTIPDIVKQTIEKRKTLIKEGKGKGKSNLVIPVMRRDEVIAVLHIQSKDGGFSQWDVMAMEALADHINSALQNAHYLREVEKRLSELRTLYELSQLIASTIKFEELLEKLSIFLKNLFAVDTFFIALYDELRNELVFEVDYEKGRKLPKSSIKIDETKGFTSWIFRNGKPLLFKDLEKEWDKIPVEPIIEGEPTRSFLGVPILTKDKVVGVISLQTFKPNSFDDKDLQLLSTLASHIGTALENARLLKERESYLLRLKYLIEAAHKITLEMEIDQLLTSIIEYGKTILKADRAAVYLVEDGRIEKIISKGLSQEYLEFIRKNINKLPGVKVFDTKKPLAVNDTRKIDLNEEVRRRILEEGILCYCVIPIIYRERLAGAFAFYRNEAIPFSEDDIEMGLTFARQAATAIANAKLFQEIKVSEERYRSLFENANDAIFLVDPTSFVIVEANSFAEKLIGISKNSLVGKHFRDLTPLEERKRFALFLRELIETGEVKGIDDLHLLNKRKMALPVELNAQKVKLGDKEILLLLARDITERKKAESEIRKRIKELRTLYHLGLDITSVLDLNSLLERVYRYVIELFGVNTFYIALYDEEKDSLVFEVDYEKGIRQKTTRVPLNKAKGFTAWIFNNNQPVLIKNWDLEWWAYPITPLDQGKKTASYLGVPLRYKDKILGVIAIQDEKQNAFDERSLELLSTMANQIGVAIQNLRLIEDLSVTLKELEKSYENTLETLVSALDFREHETQFHSKRVAMFAAKLAETMGLGEEDKKYIYWGGLLHDIGKIGVSDNILLKPGPLTGKEWMEMKKHPEIGHRILKGIDFLGPAKDIVLYHHERWDGKGYPFRLKGEKIPLYARIFAVADALDAITSERPYRRARTFKEAMEEIKRNSGTQFDPEVVKAFLSLPLSIWKRIRRESQREKLRI